MQRSITPKRLNTCMNNQFNQPNKRRNDKIEKKSLNYKKKFIYSIKNCFFK